MNLDTTKLSGAYRTPTSRMAVVVVVMIALVLVALMVVTSSRLGRNNDAITIP